MCITSLVNECSLFLGWEQPNWFLPPRPETKPKRSYRKIDYFEETESTDAYEPSFRRTNWFEPVGRECELVMNSVGVIDLTPFGKLEVSGVDAGRFMDHVCANSLPEVCVVMEGGSRDSVLFETTLKLLRS